MRVLARVLVGVLLRDGSYRENDLEVLRGCGRLLSAVAIAKGYLIVCSNSYDSIILPSEESQCGSSEA